MYFMGMEVFCLLMVMYYYWGLTLLSFLLVIPVVYVGLGFLVDKELCSEMFIWVVLVLVLGIGIMYYIGMEVM